MPKFNRVEMLEACKRGLEGARKQHAEDRYVPMCDHCHTVFDLSH